MARIGIVGGGITGLAAAWELASTSVHEVHVFEAEARFGGKIRSSPFAGLAGVDEGADAFLARVPFATTLATEVGLADQLVSPASGSAFVAHGGRLHRIPDGLVLGVPKGLGGIARSRLLSPSAKLRAAVEPLLPRSSTAHDSLGSFVRARFGNEVLARLVDPLVGSINAGDADELSLVDAVPQLAAIMQRERSLLLGLRKAPAAAPGPVFFTPRAGMAALVGALVERLEASGVALHPDRPISAIERGPRLDGKPFDGVIVCTPAHVAAGQLHVAQFNEIPFAGVVMITISTAAPLPRGSGYLVPKPDQRHVTAVSFASQKWPHWLPSTGESIVRVSLGRYRNDDVLQWDDARLVRQAADELSRHIGQTVTPTASRVTRWPKAFPQYLPHHRHRVATIRGALPTGVFAAGASFEGIGIPACIRQGRESARSMIDWLRSVQE